MEMDVKELSLPVYDPNRGRLHPRELYALVHVIFSSYLRGEVPRRNILVT